jgi:putative oxidoreductase
MEKRTKVNISSVAWASALLLSALFAYAGWAKVFDPMGFKVSIEAYKLPLAAPLVWFGAYFLPWVELFSAFGLWLRPLRTAAASLMVGMMALFTLAIAQAWARGLNFSCGCFGEALKSTENPALLFVRDVGLLYLACYLLVSFLKKDQT